MSNIQKLAIAAGLQPEWQDAGGRCQTVSNDALRTILDRLGHPSASEPQIADSLAAIAARNARGARFLSVDVDRPIRLSTNVSGQAELILEGGTRTSVTIDGGALKPIAQTGYHQLEFAGDVIDLLVAPRRCFTIADAVRGRKIWAPAVQIPSLRGDVSTAFGDFGTLADAARAFGKRGADALAISPTHALFPADASRYSPYAPSSRQFLNGLCGDPSAFGVTSEDPAPDLIDWQHAIPEKLERLRKAFAQGAAQLSETLTAFRRDGGNNLEGHAEFDALHAHFFASTGAKGWQQWPVEYHDPASHAVRRFVADHAEGVAFYAFLQWLARRDLDAAQAAAKDAGMAIGPILPSAWTPAGATAGAAAAICCPASRSARHPIPSAPTARAGASPVSIRKPCARPPSPPSSRRSARRSRTPAASASTTLSASAASGSYPKAHPLPTGPISTCRSTI
jgi:4-alpha-glucanotransferase